MNKKLVIEVHVGKRYGISRLNCDGAGQVKDVLIDNSRYNRISSQSKKRVWREHLEECLGEMEHVYRTRAIKDILMKKFAAMDAQLYQDNAEEMAEYIVKNILKCDLKNKAVDVTSQILVFTEYDIKDIMDVFCEIIAGQEEWDKLKKEAEKGKKKKEDGSGYAAQIISAVKKKLPLRSYGVDCSMFGRMTTSDVMESVESAVSVNHSYSFGQATMDNDYFTVVDNYLSDMKNELESGQSGSAYLDSKDFATHVYYEYASIDVRQLYENMTKGIDMTDESNKARVKEMMVKAICCVVRDIACSAPSGGQNAFASYPDPVGVYITIRDCGTNNRNHCPHCLSSIHLDNIPGDRSADCGGIMEPISIYVRPDGEWALIHRCKKCGELKINRIAADDNEYLLLSLACKPLANPPFPLSALSSNFGKEEK